MQANENEEAPKVKEQNPETDIQPNVSITQDESQVPAAIAEDRELLSILDAEIIKRKQRLDAARASVEQKEGILWQAQTRQDSARRLYSLSKNMMQQIKEEGQLVSPKRGSGNENPGHSRRISSMDQSRQALVDRTITTLQDAIAELQAATSDLNIAQKNLGHAVAYLQYCSRSLISLDSQYGATSEFLRDEAFALRPTPRLPDDIWRRILSFVVLEESRLPLEPRDRWQEWNFTPLALPLSHVSREWRRLTTSTPSLWTGVQIVYTKERKFRAQYLRRILGLAGGAPLTIVITLTHDLVGNVASQLADAFTEDHLVKSIKCQVSNYATPSLRSLLEVIPPAQYLTLKGLEIPMDPATNPLKIPSKHVMSVSSISVTNLSLERLPPFFFVPPPPWQQLKTLYTDLPSLLRVDVGGAAAPSLHRIVISHALGTDQGPPWYDSNPGANVEQIKVRELVVYPISRGHIPPLVRYISRLRAVTSLELHGSSVEPILASMKESLDNSSRVWLPALSHLIINDYEQHGSTLGLYIAGRLNVAQQEENGITGPPTQPIEDAVLNRCPNLSGEISELIQQHCAAGRRLTGKTAGNVGPAPQSA